MMLIRALSSKNNEEGLGLIETIAALGLAVVVVTSLVSLSVFTLRTSNRGKLFLRATKLANQEVELVRAFRDAQLWTDFVNAMLGASCQDTNSDAACSMSIDASKNLTVNSGPTRLDVGGLNEITYYFTVSDPISESDDVQAGFVDASDPVLRINVTVEWDLGGETQSTNIYTDVSSWRTGS